MLSNDKLKTIQYYNYQYIPLRIFYIITRFIPATPRACMTVIAVKTRLCPSPKIKVSSYQNSLKSVQQFIRKNVTDTQSSFLIYKIYICISFTLRVTCLWNSICRGFLMNLVKIPKWTSDKVYSDRRVC